MACNKWEETGLLFSSGELSEKEAAAFKDHMHSCSECDNEYESYQKEKKSFFTLGILGAEPSKKCDAEIIRVCSDGRKKIANVHPFPLMIKRAVVSVALLLVGFTGVVFLTNTMNHQALKNGSQIAKSVSTSSTDSIANHTSDSTTDTTPTNKLNFANTRGNLELKGVYPVDLQNK